MEAINTVFNKADDLYYAAKEEYSRPEEDMVTCSVCEKSYEAIILYIKIFLNQKNFSVTDDASLKELISLANEADERFKKAGLNLLNHKYDTEDIWMNPETAKAYIELVEDTRSIIGLN